jgi:hypothetical protein
LSLGDGFVVIFRAFLKQLQGPLARAGFQCREQNDAFLHAAKSTSEAPGDLSATDHGRGSRPAIFSPSGRRHITAEGWTTLGGMLGVVPVVCWTRPNETGDGYDARVEARTLDGRVVGAAESECSRVESKWKNRDPYAIRSMAQTRAIGRALRAPLGQIVVLAGYEPVGAEEIPSEPESASADSERPSPVDPVGATAAQLEELRTLIRTLQGADPDTDWKSRAREMAGVSAEMLTKTGAEVLIEKLQGELAATVEEDE